MKTFNQLLSIAAISFLFSIIGNPSSLDAQSIIGKWQIDGTEAQAHFSAEGVFRLHISGDDFYSIFKKVDNILATIPLNDSENIVMFAVNHISNSVIELKDVNTDEIMTLSYLGNPTIPGEMLSYLEPVLDGMGEQKEIYASGEAQYASDNNDYEDTEYDYDVEDYGYSDNKVEKNDEDYIEEYEEVENIYETTSYISNSSSVAGNWTWSGPNGTGSFIYTTDGYVKAVFNSSGNTLYGKYSQSGNHVAIQFIGGGVSNYEVRNRSSYGFEFHIQDGTQRSWNYTYQGEVTFSHSDKNAIEEAMKSKPSDDYNTIQQMILDNYLIYGY